MSEPYEPQTRLTEWGDFMAAFLLMAGKADKDSSPFHCEHDTLCVMVDPHKFSEDELVQLDEWGFIPDGTTFVSNRFGSA